jgi:hypothetical protein
MSLDAASIQALAEQINGAMDSVASFSVPGRGNVA